MTWTELLEKEVEAAYRAADGLMRRVDDRALGWKPQTGANWMTTGQLLEHMTTACGACCKGFVTGEWGMPADAPAEDMLPPAEGLPSAPSVGDARRRLAEDRAVALDMIRRSGEEGLVSRVLAAPWDPTPRPLAQHLLHMVNHLNQHKGQLFYYLKLQGQPVDTSHLYGMA
jgi:uncharacterized damage-inducible protein DinB